VLSTSADALRNSDFVLQARASGLHGPRLFLIHVLPNLKPVLYAQFWISIPVFILSEANLGILVWASPNRCLPGEACCANWKG